MELEKDRRDQRNVWHYVANAFSLCVDRIAPGAPPLGSPLVVHTGFDPLQSMPTPVSEIRSACSVGGNARSLGTLPMGYLFIYKFLSIQSCANVSPHSRFGIGLVTPG